MIETFVASVGDGLAMGIKTVDFSTIQIDCGTQQDAQTAVNVSLCRLRPRVFILSHFHLDHYNGLFAWGPENPPLSIQDVYFPRLPDMADQKEYAKAADYFQRALKDTAAYNARTRASAFTGLGMIYDVRKERKQAEDYYSRALQVKGGEGAAQVEAKQYLKMPYVPLPKH